MPGRPKNSDRLGRPNDLDKSHYVIKPTRPIRVVVLVYVIGPVRLVCVVRLAKTGRLGRRANWVRLSHWARLGCRVGRARMDRQAG